MACVANVKPGLPAPGNRVMWAQRERREARLGFREAPKGQNQPRGRGAAQLGGFASCTKLCPPPAPWEPDVVAQVCNPSTGRWTQEG